MQTTTLLAKLCAEPPCWARATAAVASSGTASSTAVSSIEGGQYDVAVVGAGITGLTAAIWAARKGLRVIVLEAGQAGAGASGRNSGFVIPALSRAGPDDLARAWGADRAAWFGAKLAGSANALFDFIRVEGIDCDARQSGWLQPDRLAPNDGTLRARLRRLRESGVKARIVERDELLASTGTDRYPAALCLSEGGQIDPLALTRGLAASFVARGGTLAADCKLVAPIRRQADGRLRLDTSMGAAFARRAVVATNANGVGGADSINRATLPFALLLAAYALPAGSAEHVLRSHQPFSDVARDMWFFRRLPDERILTGMFATRDKLDASAIESMLADRIAYVFGVQPGRMTDLWAGRIGLTASGTPQLLQLAPDVYGWAGCNGRGIALSFVMGQMLAELAAGAQAERMPMPVHPLRRVHTRHVGAWVARTLIHVDRRRRRREMAQPYTQPFSLPD